MNRLVTVAPFIALLSACGLGAAEDRMDREAYQRACDGLGIPQGTEAYSNCMVQQAAQCAEANERARNREALERLRQSR